MIELYIENRKIDITDEIEINFTYETIDPDKLSSIKNSFSKTVNIPGTSNNNKTFGYIFRYDKFLKDETLDNIDNNYDPHKKANWFINKNGALIKRGYCTLDNIITKNDYEVTYQITLYGGLGEFFYSLSYNEDGSPKTLEDLYWNWEIGYPLVQNNYKIAEDYDSKIYELNGMNKIKLQKSGSGTLDGYYCFMKYLGQQIPAEYQQLEYLESTGTQFIDTGIVLNSKAKIFTVAQYTEISTGSTVSTLWGFIETNKSSWMTGISLEKWQMSLGETYEIGTADMNKHIFINETDGVTYYKGYLDGSLGVNRSLTSTMSNYYINNTLSAIVFGINNNGNIAQLAKAKIYNFTIIQNDQYVINLIPVKRISDDVLGMYDTITGTFFTNDGTGSFNAGPEINNGCVIYEVNGTIYTIDPHNTIISTESILDAGTYNIDVPEGAKYVWTSSSYQDDSSINIDAINYVTTPEEEKSTLLYIASAENVARSYSLLNPLEDYEWTTPIYKDLVFLPCYQGIYENFDSKTMLVNTRIQNDLYNNYVNDNIKNALLTSFPDSFTKNDKTYTTLNDDLESTGLDKYGIVKFSRELDPWEAGELRVKEMPIAIRLSKLMSRITNHYNNGGYEVIWDKSIKETPYWNYSWVMIGQLNQDKKDLTSYEIGIPYKDNEPVLIDYNYGTQEPNSTTFLAQNIFSADVVQGTYSYTVNYTPTMNFNVDDDFLDMPNHNLLDSYCWYIENNVSLFMYNTYVILTIVKENNVPKYAVADVLLINNSHTYEIKANETNQLKSTLSSYISGSGTNIPVKEIIVHNITTNTVSYSGSPLTNVDIKFNNITLSHILEVRNQKNISLEQIQLITWTRMRKEPLHSTFIESGVYGVNERPHFDEYELRSFLNIPVDNLKSAVWPWYSVNDLYTFKMQMVETDLNELKQIKAAQFKVTDIYKKNLFANSESPMKYLSGFCKLMNYRFICDEAAKKIYIKDLKNYYLNNIYDLTDRVDLGRDIKITPVTAKYKNINIGLETPDTYPVTLFNRNSKEKFNTLKYVTNVEYPLSDTNLLNDLIYKNTIDWQQNSIFYNNYPQFPKGYNTTTISWNLFYKDTDNNDEIQSEQEFTLGASSIVSNLTPSVDTIPKNSLFNKENKMEDISSSLIFLNGFVKNYNYTYLIQEDNNVISPKIILSNDTYEQYYLNQERCYEYDFSYNKNFYNWGYTSKNENGSATSWVLPLFTKDLYNVFDLTNGWYSLHYKLASWNMVYQDDLDSMYSIFNTTFIKNPLFAYNKIANYISTIEENEYTFGHFPAEAVNTRIYDTKWNNYLNDLYDRNARDVTAYIDLTGFGTANEIMRHIYSWRSNLWIITKLENFTISEIGKDKFTKVTMHKIKDISTWTNA